MSDTESTARRRQVVRTVNVPGYEGRGVRVQEGDSIRVTDVCGTQIGDVFVLAAEDHYEFLSASVTRAVTWKLFPTVGDSFYTNLRRPILTFLEDHSPGIHDMLFAACDRGLFEALGVDTYHPNCRDNYKEVAREMNVENPVVPDPVNIFENTPIDCNGALLANVTPTKPGDYVVFKAEMDLLFILTACSCDVGLNQINGGKSTPLRIEVVR